MTIDQAIKTLQAAKRAVAKEYKTCEGWSQFKNMDSKEVLKRAGSVQLLSKHGNHVRYPDLCWDIIDYYSHEYKYKGILIGLDDDECW